MVTTLNPTQILLQSIGPGRITPSIYDIAWVARLAELGEPVGEAALDILRGSQLPDGSWGTPDLVFHHERLIATLAVATTLARLADTRDENRLRRARHAIEIHAGGLKADHAGETIGFEIVLPALINEAYQLDIVPNHNRVFDHFIKERQRKLSNLPHGKVNKHVTLAFSLEMFGTEGAAWVDPANIREENGSVACSPAATAWYMLNIEHHEKSLEYILRSKVNGSGAVPYTAPIDVFEIAWTLWNIALAGLHENNHGVTESAKPHLDFLERHWSVNGIPAVSELSLPDGDTSAMVFNVLSIYGREVDIQGVNTFEEEGHFRCFGFESNPSLSTNVHALHTLLQFGLDYDHPKIEKLVHFLRQARTIDTFWYDKWHASPYYTTAHAIIALRDLDKEMARKAVQWITDTQNADGSWGYYLPTAEETAYCLQALILWRRAGGKVPNKAIDTASLWLNDNREPPYPPLWIGKCLYHPEHVLRSAILSALTLAEQG
jgi:halimadienyl-diphosphate synthase